MFHKFELNEFLQSIVTVIMKTEDAIINFNRQGPCKYINMDLNVIMSINILKAPINNPDSKCVRKIHVTTASNVK